MNFSGFISGLVVIIYSANVQVLDKKGIDR